MEQFIFVVTMGSLIYASVYDIVTRKIPNISLKFLLRLGILKDLALFCSMGTNSFPLLLNSLLGFLIPSLIFLAIGLKKDEAIGGGDIKLYGLIGLIYGIKDVVVIIFFSSLFAILFFLLFKRAKSLPLAPFITIGTLLNFAIAVYF